MELLDHRQRFPRALRASAPPPTPAPTPKPPRHTPPQSPDDSATPIPAPPGQIQPGARHPVQTPATTPSVPSRVSAACPAPGKNTHPAFAQRAADLVMRNRIANQTVKAFRGCIPREGRSRSGSASGILVIPPGCWNREPLVSGVSRRRKVERGRTGGVHFEEVSSWFARYSLPAEGNEARKTRVWYSSKR